VRAWDIVKFKATSKYISNPCASSIRRRERVEEEPSSISPDELPSSAPPPTVGGKRLEGAEGGEDIRTRSRQGGHDPAAAHLGNPALSGEIKLNQPANGPKLLHSHRRQTFPYLDEGRGRAPRAHPLKETQSTNAGGDIQARAKNSEQEVQATRGVRGIPRAHL